LTALLVLTSVFPSGFALATNYAGDFEELGTSARAIGIGGAAVAFLTDPSAIYYNPSLSSRSLRPAALLMHSEDFAGLLQHNFLAVTIPSARQALGIAILHNGIPGIKLTRLPVETLPPGENNRPYVWRTVSATQLVAYINYARAVSPWLAAGGNAKVIYQDLGGTGACFGMGLDLGLTVTPLTDLDVGLRVRNASTSPLFWDTGTLEYIFPRCALGLARTMRLGRDRLALAIETEADLQDWSLQPNLGIEYGFRQVLYGRLGFYRGNFAFGLGLHLKRFHIEYGYASGAAPGARELGSPQQLSGGVEF
jgi:hypothetical protein